VSARLGDRGRELIARWARGAGEAVEIYEKRGRSRGFELGPDGESFTQSVEAGWAARGGDSERSWFLAGSGELPATLERPPVSAPGVWLPPRSERTPAEPPRGLDAPLATEPEGRALLAGVARELLRELPDVAPPRLRLEEGSSEAALVSSRGVAAAMRGRTAALRAEVARGGHRIRAEFAARAAVELKPLALARRLADRLLALEGALPTAVLEELVLAPPVAARLIEALAPRFVGAEAERRLASLLDRERRIGSAALTLVDDGSLEAGALAAPFDGEGVPTGGVALVEGGRFVQPLLAGAEHAAPQRAAGCARRDGWRDVPRQAPTQLYVAPDPTHAVAELVAGVARGGYLISPESSVTLGGEGGDEFSLAVSGFVLAGGRSAGGLGRCRLEGRFGALLHGVRAVARDLTFVPGDGLFGAPTLLVAGLVLRAEPR
jgi:PmbA protein